MSRTDINDEALVRYLTGDAEPEEAIAITDWLKVAQNRAHFDALETSWRQSAGDFPPTFDKKAAWNKLSATVHIPAESLPVAPRPSFWPFGIAAAIIVVLSVATYYLFFLPGHREEPEMGSASTTDGFRFVEFSDRSTATMHRNSELRYPDQFSSESRLVRLVRGEAFFNITTDAGRPFLIEVSGVQIKVLGTEFNVEVKDSVISIHVREGRVLVTSNTDRATLVTGMTGEVRAGRISVSRIPVGNLYSYATQRLVFEDAPLKRVIRDLEDSYPCTIELRNTSLENCRLTANFYKDDIDKIVNLVAETLNLSVAKNGRHFTLDGEGCL